MKICPVLSKPSYQILTQQNLSDTDIEYGMYYLDDILVKQGEYSFHEVKYPILNVSRCKLNKNQALTLTSPYDGSKLKYSVEAINKSIDNFGIKKIYDPNNILEGRHNWDFNCEDDLIIENTSAIQNALEGKFFDNTKLSNISDELFELDYSMLSAFCDCEACSGKLTKAYFHHLYANTPFLAQRWLAIHNLKSIKNHKTEPRS